MDSTDARLELQKDAGLTTTICDQDHANASLRGWEAYSCGTFTGGCWSLEEALLHINVLEMLAVLYGILCEGRSQGKYHPHQLRQYNSGVLSESHGGTKSQTLIETARQVWEWCLQRNITLSAQYLLGLENVRTDFLSRYLTDRTDWHLNPTIFQCFAVVGCQRWENA